MSGMDVLRERIARALWEESGGTREWAKLPDDVKKGSGAYDMADAVIAVLGLVEERDANVIAFRYDDRAHHWETRRRYVTPWERIEDDT